MRGVETPQATPLLDQLVIAAEFMRAKSRRLYREADELRRIAAQNENLVRRLRDSDTQHEGRRTA